MESHLELIKGDYLLPEQKLWAAVLHRALLDACGSVAKADCDARKQIGEISDDAIKWFKYKHKGFLTVCDFIGLDSDEVRRLALGLIRETQGKSMGHHVRGRRRSDVRG
jgi:hypothetical protein